MNKNIPQSILDGLPELDPEKYEYAWGPCDSKPGLELWHRRKWIEGSGSGSGILYRWPKPEPRYELIPKKDMRTTDEFCPIAMYGTDMEIWRKCRNFFDVLDRRAIIIRRRIEEVRNES